MYKLTLVSTFILLCVTGALIGAPVANAASDYDNAVQTTDELILTNWNSANTLDITENYATKLEECSPSAFTSFSAAISSETGKWVIHTEQQKQNNVYYDGYKNIVRIMWTQGNSTASFSKSGDGTIEYLTAEYSGTGAGVAELFMKADGSLACYYGAQDWGANISTYTSPSSPSPLAYPTSKIFVLYGTSITYPSGYEGDIPPESVAQPLTPLDYWIDYSYTNTQQSITATYTGKQTDPISNLPDPQSVTWNIYEDFTPPDEEGAVYGDLLCTATRLTSDPFNSLEDCAMFDFNPDNRKLILVAYVNPESPANIHLKDNETWDINFQQTVYIVDFSKTSTGTTTDCEPGAIGGDYQSGICAGTRPVDFLECFMPAFPFVDVNTCTKNFNVLINLLSFKTISFGNDWTGANGCTNLAVLGDWLPLENKTVCPQFPQYIRTIVTPFVTFILGLITIKFLSRKEGYL